MKISNVARLNRPAKVVILASIVLASILAIQYLRPQPSAPTSVILGVADRTYAHWPMFIGADAGTFQKYGLNVTVVFLGTGRDTIIALTAGQIQIGGVGPYVSIPAKLEGLEVVLIGVTESARPYYLATNPNINSVEQLKGKVGGVAAIGSGLIYFATVIMLRQLGLDPAKDVTLVAISGSEPARLAALQAGRIDFALTQNPGPAKKLGLNVLLYLPDIIKSLPGTGYSTTTKYLRENREIVKKFIMSLTEATKFFFDNKEESKKILSKWLEENDPETLEQYYQDWARVALRIPELKLDQVESVLEAMAPFIPKAVGADPKQFVDGSIIKELESEGFFKRIWGS